MGRQQVYYLSQSEGEDLARRPCRVRDCPRHEGTQALRSLWAKRTEPLRMGTGACRPAGGTQSQKSCSEPEPGGHAGPPWARSPRAAQNQNRGPCQPAGGTQSQSSSEQELGAMPARHGLAVPEKLLRTRTGGPRRPAMGMQSQSRSETEPGVHASPPGARSPRAAQNQNWGPCQPVGGT